MRRLWRGAPPGENQTTKTVVVFIVKHDGILATETRYGTLPPGEGLTFWGSCWGKVRDELVARDSAGNFLERHACLKVWEAWVIQSPPT